MNLPIFYYTVPKFPPEEADREKKRREEKVSTHGKLDFLPAFSSQIDFYHRQKGKLLYLDFTLINMQGTSAIKSSFTVLDRKGHVPFTSSLLKHFHLLSNSYFLLLQAFELAILSVSSHICVITIS